MSPLPTKAPWQDDSILTGLLNAMECDGEPIDDLARPFWIRLGAGRPVLGLDYSYCILLRSLCRAFLEGGRLQGAMLSLFRYQVGRRLNASLRRGEASIFLMSACELRSRYAVSQGMLLAEAAIYQRGMYIIFFHELAHSVFERDTGQREDWFGEAGRYVDHLATYSQDPRSFPDPTVRQELASSAQKVRASAVMLEEVACDLYAVALACGRELQNMPDKAQEQVDLYLLAARIVMISLFAARSVADALPCPRLRVRGELHPDFSVANLVLPETAR